MEANDDRAGKQKRAPHPPTIPVNKSAASAELEDDGQSDLVDRIGEIMERIAGKGAGAAVFFSGQTDIPVTAYPAVEDTGSTPC